MARPGTMICALVVALTYASAPSHAQTPDVSLRRAPDSPWNRGVALETREAARQLFLEGNRLFRVPLFARAAEKYRAALETWKHPAFYFNLALAQLNLGGDLEAHETLDLAMRHGADPIGADQFAEGRKQMHDLEGRLGRIRVSCSTAGAEVSLDGAALFTGPGSYEGWVAARKHEITARKPQFMSESKRVTVAGGKRESVELALISVDDAADAGRRWAKWKPWTAVIAGVAVAATGGTLHAIAARNFKSHDRAFVELPCANSGGCAPGDIPVDLSSRLGRAHREQQVAVGAYVAGGALIAAGAVLLYLNRPRLLEQPAGSIAVVPAVSSDMVGIALTVRH